MPVESMWLTASASNTNHDGLGRRGADRLAHAALDVARVREEEAVVEPVDDDARRHARRRVERDVAVALDVRHPAEHGVVGARAPAHGVDDREPDRDDERLEHAEDDDAAHRHARDRDLDAVDPRPAPARRPGRRCRSRRRRSPRRAPPAAGTAPARSGRAGSRRSSRGEEAGDLRARAHRVVHRGARAARADREALREAGRGVRRAHRQQLLRRAHVSRGACRRTRARSGSRRRTRRGRARAPPARARRRRRAAASARVGRGSPLATGPTIATPWLARSSAHETPIAADDDDQRAGERSAGSGGDRAARRATTTLTASVIAAHVAELADHLPQPPERLASRRCRARAACRAARSRASTATPWR